MVRASQGADSLRKVVLFSCDQTLGRVDMTFSTIFYLYILRFVIAGGGWLSVIFNEWHERRETQRSLKR
jgi:hypothetical protein